MPAVSRSGSGSAPGISDPRSTSGEADSFTGTSLRTRPSARSLHRRSAGRGVCAIFAKWGKTSSGSDGPCGPRSSRRHSASPLWQRREALFAPSALLKTISASQSDSPPSPPGLPTQSSPKETSSGPLSFAMRRGEESPNPQPNAARNTRSAQPLQTPRQPTVDRQLLQIGLGRISEAVV
jgi:hypothetical protein